MQPGAALGHGFSGSKSGLVAARFGIARPVQIPAQSHPKSGIPTPSWPPPQPHPDPVVTLQALSKNYTPSLTAKALTFHGLGQLTGPASTPCVAGGGGSPPKSRDLAILEIRVCKKPAGPFSTSCLEAQLMTRAKAAYLDGGGTRITMDLGTGPVEHALLDTTAPIDYDGFGSQRHEP